MPYVIVNTDTGKYVAPAGSERSYTGRLENARPFATRVDAERELCPGNEGIRPALPL